MAFISAITELDTNLLLWINSLHNTTFDQLMSYVTRQNTWLPLFAIILWLLVSRFKIKSIWILVFIAIMICITDMTPTFIFKPWVARLRPCHNPGLKDQLHMVMFCGGKYGFFSSHASNSFALATFISFLLGKKYKYFNIFLFVWATLFSYSRIYLGKHYPLDIIAGACFGTIIAWLIFKISNASLSLYKV